jgi:hypothetical protein
MRLAAIGGKWPLCGIQSYEGGTPMILRLVALLVLGLMYGGELNVAFSATTPC